MATCQASEINSYGTFPICSETATYLYTNGDYRRLECDYHAAVTQTFIRPSSDPRDPKLTLLSATAAEAPRAAGGE